MKKSKKMSILLSTATIALALGMFALAGCSSTTSSNTTNTDTSKSSTPAATSYTKDDVEKACSAGCHSLSAVDSWTAADVTATTARGMVPSLTSDQAAAIAAYYASK